MNVPLLICLVLNIVKGSEINHSSDPNTLIKDDTLNEIENEAEAATFRSKRKFNEIHEIANSNVEMMSFITPVFNPRVLKVVYINFNHKKIPEYINDPISEFFDKLMRQSLGLKLSETNNEVLWEMECTNQIDLSWHVNGFIFLMMKSNGISEDCMINYLEFITERWGHRREIYPEDKAKIILLACKKAISLQYIDLLELALKSIVFPTRKVGIELLSLHKKRIPFLSSTSNVNWQMICKMIIRKFQYISYDPLFRIKEFMGSERSSKGLFIHLLPIFNTLMITEMDEFEADLEFFDIYALFCLGDFEAKLPIGKGGLEVVNQMFLRSHVNISAFKTKEEEQFKVAKIERLVDALFLGFKFKDLVEYLFNQKAISIFESFLKYSNESIVSNAEFYEIMSFLLEKVKTYDDFCFILVLLAHYNIPKIIWSNLRDKYEGIMERMAYLDILETFSEILADLPAGTIIDLAQNQLYGLNINTKLLNELPNLGKRPIQLELMRIFMSRSCGIPIEMTRVSNCSNESFEWSESVEFLNFYIERTAEIMGYSGEIVRFKII